MTRPSRYVPFGFLALLCACGSGAADPGSEVVIDTLPNGAVHVANSGGGIWSPEERLTLVTELRIGATDGTGPDVFGQIRGIETDRAGRIYVLDTQANAVRIFGPEGEFLRTIGREGAGPAEFRGAFGIRLDAAERLWVADYANGRYSVFDPGGELIESHTRPILSYGFIWDGEFLADGLIESGVFGSASGESQSGLIRMNESFEPIDTLGVPTHLGTPVAPYEHRTAEVGFGASVPFTPRLSRAFESDSTIWWGLPESYKLHLFTLDLDTVRIVERDHTPVPVTAAERDSALGTDYFERMRAAGAQIDPGRVPPNKPAFEWFIRDTEGRLWVKLPNPEGVTGSTLDVFDSEGRYLGQTRSELELEPYPRPIVRGNVMLGVVRDALDVQNVVRIGIQRGPD